MSISLPLVRRTGRAKKGLVGRRIWDAEGNSSEGEINHSSGPGWARAGYFGKVGGPTPSFGPPFFAASARRRWV